MNKRAEIISKLVPPPARILDLGCGNGIVSLDLVEFGNYSILGIDLNENKLRNFSTTLRAKEIKGNVEIVNANYLDYSFKGEFDAVISFASLDHLASKDIAKAIIQKLQQITRRGGTHLVSIHIGEESSSFPSKFDTLNELGKCYSSWNILKLDTMDDGKLGTLGIISAQKK